MRELAPRERRAAILAAVAVLALMLDRVILTPLFEAREQLVQQRQLLEAELRSAHELVREGRRDRRRMRDYRQAGLGTSPAAGESELLGALRMWADEARLTLVSVRPDRTAAEHGLAEVVLYCGAEGGTGAMAELLYHLETAAMPVRVRELQIAARPENPARLSVQVRLSTLWDQSPERTAMAGMEASDE